MKHLSEEEQLDIYYEDGSEESKAHLKACRECSAEYAKFKRSLDAIKPEAVPTRGADYGEQVWQRLQSRLIPYEKMAAQCCWRRHLLGGGIGSTSGRVSSRRLRVMASPNSG